MTRTNDQITRQDQFMKAVNRQETAILGILNVTPDSFYDGGRFNDLSAAVDQTKAMVDEGADAIDIGAESTRPGHIPVSEDDEISRLIPIISAIRKTSQIPISVDTCKASVARAAIKAGADIINDVHGLRRDSQMAKVAAEYDAPVIAMHNRMGLDPIKNMLADITAVFKEIIQIAAKNGVKKDRLILDPGVGFGKSVDQNCEIVGNLDQFSELGCPLLMGLSRKSFIAAIFNDPDRDRLAGTIAANLVSIGKGAAIIRVHDVSAHKDALMIWQATQKN